MNTAKVEVAGAGVVIGLDLGTTHVKALALDAGGRALAAAQRALEMHTPAPGWAQQDPGEVERAALAVLGEVAGRVPGRIDAVCLSGAMHSLLALDERDRPLGEAMTWADVRAAEDVDLPRDRSRYADTGCPAHVSYHPARLRWWSRQEQCARVRRFVALKDWVLHRLTGVLATDIALASTTALLHTSTGAWHDEALRGCDVTAEQLCPVVDSRHVVGVIQRHVAPSTGLPTGCVVVAGGSDGALANLGAAGAGPDRVVITVGTSAAVRWNVASPRLDEQQRTWCYRAPAGGWLAGGAINNAGLAVQWIAQRFYAEQRDPVQALVDEAMTVPPGCEGLMMLPYLSGERAPHYRGDLSAALLGLSLQHQRAHVARAVLESTAFCLAQVWSALGPPAHEARLTGGITRQPGWVQLLADVLGVTLEPMTTMDASTRGAAVLGHAALGRELPAPPHEPPVPPDATRHAEYQPHLQRWAQAVAEAIGSRR